MSDRRAPQGLKKRYLFVQQGWRICAVNAFAIRSIALPDEEFTNFATRDDFRDLIPKGEIWIARENLEVEGIFCIANAMVQLKQREQGVDEKAAYKNAVQLEQELRHRVNGIPFRDGRPQLPVPKDLYTEHYLTLHDEHYPIDVWRVDGNLVRSLYKTDYTEGGHGQVYPWCPKTQIWVEKDLNVKELPFIVCHEYLELRLMRERGLAYDRAHSIAAKMEFALRKGKGLTHLMAPGRSTLDKRHLPNVVKPEVFKALQHEFLKR